MAKMLSMRDFDYSKIGNIFELDEVTPQMATEERLDDSGNKIMGNDGTTRKSWNVTAWNAALPV